MANLDKKELSDLFIKIKNGDQEAAQELYNKYRKLVYGIAFSITKNKDDSEDIVQNAFTKIIESEANKLPTNHEATWMYTVTKNEALLFLRNKNNDLNIEEVYEIQDGENELEKVIDKETYNKMLSKLSKRDKEIISLKIISGLSFNEIGSLMNESTGTIKWRYYKAVYRLKTLLSGLSMATVSFVAGLFTLKNSERFEDNNIVPDENTTNERNTIDLNWGEGYDSINEAIENRDFQDKNTKNETENYSKSEPTNEITVMEPQPAKQINYIGYGFMALSIIFLVVAVTLFFKKYQPKQIKKSSK